MICSSLPSASNLYGCAKRFFWWLGLKTGTWLKGEASRATAPPLLRKVYIQLCQNPVNCESKIIALHAVVYSFGSHFVARIPNIVWMGVYFAWREHLLWTISHKQVLKFVNGFRLQCFWLRQAIVLANSKVINIYMYNTDRNIRSFINV